MKALIETTLSSLRDALHRRIEAREACQTRSTEILTTVENVVDATDSRIRLVGNYRKVLQGVIQNSLDFTDTLVDRIPSAIEVSHRSFLSDPYVNAFFVNATDLQTVFSHSSEIRDFMDDYSKADLLHCYALLCMRKSEKTVMGMELAGDMLRKDVCQTSVSFSDHRIYSPGPSESETREGLKHCLFGGLVTNALERIMEQKLASHRLQNKRHKLQARLRNLQQEVTQAQQQGTPAPTGALKEIDTTRRALGDLEKALLNIHPATPQDSLEQLTAVLGRPDHHVRIDTCALKLNKMGIKVSDNSHQPCNEIELTEVSIGDEPPRVVTLAKFPRDELLPQTDFLSQKLFS